jgi:hypothetical protein
MLRRKFDHDRAVGLERSLDVDPLALVVGKSGDFLAIGACTKYRK